MYPDAAITPLELEQRLAAFPPPALVDTRRQPFRSRSQRDPRRDPMPAGSGRILGRRARSLAQHRRLLRPRPRGRPRRGRGAAFPGARRALPRGRPGAVEGGRRRGLRGADALGDARASQDRPHRVPVAHSPLHRPGGGALLRAESRSAGVRRRQRCDCVRHPRAAYGHVGAECSFDAFIRLHELRDPALDVLAGIVRGADTSSLHLAAAPGLLAVSRGLSALFGDDHAMLKWGMLVYDALYQSCRESETTRGMPEPQRTRAAASNRRSRRSRARPHRRAPRPSGTG